MATDATLDAALARALADEVASVLPELTTGSDATSPTTTEEVAMQPCVGFATKLQATPSGSSDKELVRRMKAREKERRRYYRNKDRMSDLQRQVESLECQLWALSADSDSLRSLTAFEQEGGIATVQGQREQLQHRLAAAIRATARLRNENTKLRQKSREESQRMALISDLLHSEHKLYIANSTYFRLLKPLTPRACASISAQCVEDVAAFHKGMVAAAPLSGSLSGWRETRLVDEHLFKFTIKKAFHNVTSRTACAQVWAMLLDPVRNVRLYSEVLHAKIRFVQKVSEDDFVFLEQMSSMDPESDAVVVVKAAMLLSRVKTPRGYRIHMRGLDHAQVMVEDLLPASDPLAQEMWNTSAQFTWIDFEEAAGACVVSFAGMTPTVGANVNFWMREVMLLCLRGENETIGIRFSLPA